MGSSFQQFYNCHVFQPSHLNEAVRNIDKYRCKTASWHWWTEHSSGLLLPLLGKQGGRKKTTGTVGYIGGIQRFFVI